MEIIVELWKLLELLGNYWNYGTRDRDQGPGTGTRDHGPGPRASAVLVDKASAVSRHHKGAPYGHCLGDVLRGVY